jgi:two-component system nitrogen regulation sensor histidine kinase GlnL
LNDLPSRTLESVNVGIVVFDEAGKLAYVNPAAEEILQGSFQSLSGRHYRAVFRGSPAAVRILRKPYSSHSPVTGFDVELRTGASAGGSGGTLPVMLGASPLTGATGEPQGVVLSVKSSEILSLVGREEEAALGAEGMQMLAYGMAHEIKNPLGGILGAAQWVLRGEGPEEERVEGVRLILREARRINDLVEKMLEMGKKPPPPRPFALAPLLREAQQLILSEARSQGKKVQVDLRLDPSLPAVSGHPDTVYRALLNILKNALEAIPESGTVRIEARMNVNTGSPWGAGGSAPSSRSSRRLRRRDDGGGAAQGAPPLLHDETRGTGLGLAMARQAASRHGGKLEIMSTPGEGTTLKYPFRSTRAGRAHVEKEY